MIKVRSVRERYEIQERCLKSAWSESFRRLWSKVAPISGFMYLASTTRTLRFVRCFRPYPTARRLTILAFVKTDEGVRRFHGDARRGS